MHSLSYRPVALEVMGLRVPSGRTEETLGPFSRGKCVESMGDDRQVECYVYIGDE